MSSEVRRARLADYSVFPLGWLSERKTSVDVTLGHGDGGPDWAEGADDAMERLLPPRYKKRKEKNSTYGSTCVPQGPLSHSSRSDSVT